MPEAAPVPEDAPDILTLLKRITARHPDDVSAGRLPDFPEYRDHFPTLDWLAREADNPENTLPREDLTDGLLLARLLRHRTDWIVLTLIQAAKRTRGPRMTARQIGAPLGIESRQGLNQHVASLTTRMEAHRKHMRAAAIRRPDTNADTSHDRPPRNTARALAAAVLTHWGDLGASNETLDDITGWAEGMELILAEEPTEAHAASEAGSLRAQLRFIVEGLDAGAHQPKTAEAARVLREVRAFLDIPTPGE